MLDAEIERLRRSEANWRSIVENAPDIITTIDAQGRIQFINNVVLEDLTPESAVGLCIYDFVHPEFRHQVREVIERAFVTGQPCSYETVSSGRGGNEAWYSTRVAPIKQGDRVESLMLVSTDITAQKIADYQLRASLAEKETLLQEVHHRVKNNLQVITSLLNLQRRNVDDERVRRLLEDSSDRVASMALVHERLYSSGSLDRIDFADYVRQLAAAMVQSYSFPARPVQLVMDLEPVHFELNTAIPSGLILNELLSNALKHAFRGERGGTIYIDVRQISDTTLQIEVRDDGAGMPPGFDIESSQTLGMRLVKTLTEQLHGTIGIASDGGTRISIRLPRRKEFAAQ